MVFSSYLFLFGFLPAILLAYYVAPRPWRSLVLTAGSYVFYGWWRPDFMGLMLLSTVVDFFCGQRIHAAQGRARRLWLALSVGSNLSLLGYFKYMNFGVETLNRILAEVGHSGVSWPEVVLPIGISFYTFQTMSYSIDVYRGVSRPQERWIDFACFVALFPQLIAGPIVRYNTLAEQLRKRTHTLTKFATGALFFQIGFAKKVLLADTVAPIAHAAFEASRTGQALGALGAWLGTLAYTFQIYFDFSGYSDMAIGLGMMFGFIYPPNFDAPYKSQSITEFWRRWHISLSTWLRDYLYVPLGGNRRGVGRTYVNLSLVMLLGGLWHGAAWTYVVWGAWQGLWLVLERLLGKRAAYRALPAAVRVLLTFFVVLLGWVVFRSADLGSAGRHLAAMAGSGGLDGLALGPVHVRPLAALMLVVAAVMVWTAPTTQRLIERPMAWKSLWAFVIFVAAVLQLQYTTYSPFLYFQF